MIIIDILEPPAFKNIAHVGSFKHFVFVYLRISVIVYLCILHLIHGNVLFYISLNPMLFKNIAHVGSSKHFVFVYLCNRVFVYFTFDTQECHIRYP